MTITRMQEPRQLYGLGSLVKKITKPIKKVVKSVGKVAKSPIGLAALGLGGAGLLGMGPFSGLANTKLGTTLFGMVGPGSGAARQGGLLSGLFNKFSNLSTGTKLGIGGGLISALAASGMSEAEIEETQNALSVSEKINAAFKEIKGLEDHEGEMNDIAKMAVESYEQLMQLGMNVSDMAAGKVFAEASNMLKIALDASDAKTKAKLQQIDLMLKKARIDKFSDKGSGETEGVSATVFDRNDLLKIIKGENDKK